MDPIPHKQLSRDLSPGPSDLISEKVQVAAIQTEGQKRGTVLNGGNY